MPREVLHFTATIPAGTPLSAPAVIPISFDPREVISVYWRVPNGGLGQWGWQLAMGGVQVIPKGGDKYVVANNEHDTWYPTDHPDSGAWEVIGYNTGKFAHSVYLAFSLDPPGKPARVRPLLTAQQLAEAPDLSQLGPPVLGYQ